MNRNVKTLSNRELHSLAWGLREVLITHYQGGTCGDGHLETQKELAEVRAEIARRFPGVPGLDL